MAHPLCLEYDLDHRVCGQGAVQLVQLRPAGRRDGDSDTQVFSAFAFPQLYRAGIEIRVELARNVRDGTNKSLGLHTHDLYRKQAGVLNK